MIPIRSWPESSPASLRGLGRSGRSGLRRLRADEQFDRLAFRQCLARRNPALVRNPKLCQADKQYLRRIRTCPAAVVDIDAHGFDVAKYCRRLRATSIPIRRFEGIDDFGRVIIGLDVTGRA